MNISGRLIAIPWVVLIAYWIISARGVKRDAYRSGSWQWWAAVRILIIIAVFVGIWRTSHIEHPLVSRSPTIVVVGVVLCTAGIAFAIWARRTLGSNWSVIPSIKEGHELATAGPYRLVRHPIYGGILMGLVGSALADGLAEVWLLVLPIISLVFIYRIRSEERLMMRQFPNEYADYARTTKAIIPFLL